MVSFWNRIRECHDKTNQLLVNGRAAMVQPKLLRLMPVIVGVANGSSEARAFWVRGTDDYVYLVPEAEVHAACARFEDCIKQQYGDLDIAAADAHALLATLDCADLGMVAEMLYAVAGLQIACAAMRSSFERANKETSGFDSTLYGRFKILRHYTTKVIRLNVARPEALEAFTRSATIPDRLGLPCVAGAQFAALAQIGVKESSDLAEQVKLW